MDKKENLNKKHSSQHEKITIETYSHSFKETGGKLWKWLKISAKVISLAFVGLFFAGVIAVFGVYFNFSNEFNSIKPETKSTQLVLYDREGNEIYKNYGAAEPDRVKLSDVPENVKRATLAAEDLDFYNHGAIDLKGILRAAYYNWQNSEEVGLRKVKDLLNEEAYTQGGGSTITQQLVKNIYLTPERSFQRKIKEIVFSYKLENKYSKDEILEMYLNEIYYGEQALGIKNAARIFYDKNLEELNLAEISMLAGLPQAPTYYSPLGDNFNASKKRQEYVLQKMYLAKYISLEEAKTAANEELEFYGRKEVLNKYPFFNQYVKNELTNLFGADVVEKGLKVYTTLDPKKQELAERVVGEQLKKLSNRGASNAATVMSDPQTFEILAMVGGVDWEKSKVNVATSARQPGSSFKPLVYAAGLENGYTAATIFADKYVNFGGNPPYVPKNYDLRYNGNVTMRTALARSLNVPAVEMGKLVGLDKIVDLAHELGISDLQKEPSSYGLPLALGSGEVKLVDMVSAYSVFANGGKRMPQTAITKVLDQKGDKVNLPKRNAKAIISPESAYIISSILSDNKARSATFGSNSPLKTEKTTAVKTGTTENYGDSWTLGYSPKLVVGVWMGNNDNTPMKRVSGVEGAAYIWNNIMNEALKDSENYQFEKPATLKELYINPRTGALAKTSSRPNILEYFKPGTEPKEKVDLSYLKQF